MKRAIWVATLGLIIALSGGCDMDRQTVGLLAASAVSGDLGLLTAYASSWVDDRGDNDSESQEWYCWPACSWFD